MKRVLTTCLLFLVIIFPAFALGHGFNIHAAAVGGVIHRSPAFGADLFFHYEYEKFSVTAGAPLRFTPEGIRRQDWDEPADFGRILPHMSWSLLDERLSITIGPIHGFTLGVGNIVSHFYSTVDPDHFRSGLLFHADGDWIGLDAFFDSFIKPEVMGGRFYIRPLWFINPASLWGRLEIAGTVAGDIAAPYAWKRLSSGPVRLSDHGLPASHVTGLSSASMDLRWTILHLEAVDVTPYGAWSLFDNGAGGHVGLALDIRPTNTLQFSLQGEWKRMGGGYVSPGFGMLYMLDRHAFGPAPRLFSVRDIDAPRDGWRVGVSAQQKNIFNAWLLLDLDRFSLFSQFSGGLDIFLPFHLQLGLFFAEQGLTGWSALIFPGRFLFSSELTWEMSPNYLLFASYSRDVDIAEGAKKRGRYEPSDTALVGFRLSF